MRTAIEGPLANTQTGAVAAQALRACVHCGMCNAVCPTYQLAGDELEGPRGRIYLMKQVLEGAKPTRLTLDHLDSCLSCRSCETTCLLGLSITSCWMWVVKRSPGPSPAPWGSGWCGRAYVG